MNVKLISYYFHNKEQMNFGPYPIIYQLGKEFGEVYAGGTTFSANIRRKETIDNITVNRIFSPNLLQFINMSYVLFGIGLYKKFKDFDGILHAQNIDSCVGFKLLHTPKKIFTIRSYIRSWIRTVPEIENVPIKDELRNSFLKVWEELIVKNSDYIISPSEFYKDETVRYFNFDEKKIKVIPNGVDINFFYPKMIKTDKKIVLFAGGTSYRKGYDIVIETYKKIKRHDVEFWVIGDGGYFDGIKFFRNVPYEQMPEFYNKASVIIHPSRNENCPKVILEAMSCGKPVVTLNVTGNVELIDSGIDGICTNRESFADEVNRLLNDEDVRKKMGENARKKIVEKYSLETMIDRYKNLYSSILNGE